MSLKWWNDITCPPVWTHHQTTEVHVVTLWLNLCIIFSVIVCPCCIAIWMSDTCTVLSCACSSVLAVILFACFLIWKKPSSHWTFMCLETWEWSVNKMTDHLKTSYQAMGPTDDDLGQDSPHERLIMIHEVRQLT